MSTMALAFPVLLCVLTFLLPVAYFWVVKRRINDYKHIPQIRPDSIFGHIRIIHKAVQAGRPSENIDYVFQRIISKLGWPSICIFDLRPIRPQPILIVSSPDVADQIAKPSFDFRYSVTKSNTLSTLEPLIGSTSILTKEGEDWKRVRSKLNPAFARSHLISSLSDIVTMSKRFLKILDELADNHKVFALGDLTTALTFDIIGSVVLGLDFHAQEGTDKTHPLYKAFADIAHCFADESLTAIIDPTRWWNKRRLGQQLDEVVKETIMAKFSELQAQDKHNGRSVLELSLRGIDSMTDEILQECADSQKTFLFAGHDTTSITLQWAIYELSRYPQTAQTLKEELNTVFGDDSDPFSVCDQILARGEEALKQLHFTRAVIKETLRLYPPASSARLASRNTPWTVSIPETGEILDVNNFTLYINHYLIGRNPKVYGQNADAFHPERWIGNSDTGMPTSSSASSVLSHANGSTNAETKEKIPDAAWRPFERGPRNCIGQELANLEACVILACVARHYKFTKAGLGALEVGPDGQYVLDEKIGAYRVKGGTELYNRRQITSRPLDDMRMTVCRT